MFHVIFSMPCLYVITRFVWPMPWAPSAKIAVALLMLLASQYHLFARISSGSVFSPEFPRYLVMLFNWAFGAILLVAVLQLVVDLSTLLIALIRQNWVTVPGWLRYGIGIIAMVLAAIGVQQAVRVPPVKDVVIAVKGLPSQFEGYKALQLTDLHISRLYDETWTQAVVKASNALGVDLIVVTGDLIDGSIDDRRQDIEALRELRAPDGVYVIPGNHEYFFDNKAWIQHFVSLGMMPLSNSHTVIERQGAQVVLAGVTDVTAPETGFPPPDLPHALAGAPKDAPVILLDHQPRNARDAASHGVALQLSGHTHGGMILGLDRLIALANGGFVSGLYTIGNMQLYVNNGTALWPGFAVRLGKPSELTRMTLRRAADLSP
ncbi:metallophosphoesterase [Pseudomonas alliivorans]|uniref:Metallophosphoesterase n=1 Tax=Pseudomonas alliivorans TaxID=2810613 RepID=A0ABS4C5M0_9PSED|nr:MULTISPECIES: metallophosphoesterase [Pseudomonas]MBP0940376.1 metallophosphoesterase [Pseudomonas alliivorans]MBP0945952.1 metallophosphoesterase [Pseudomonas alliivorans]MEE4326474.1 metallophosphoesterase [Pseudomonas alliivorans]MEE4333569.1 metallophosphoesterase [Pseudomonas alliivorans]MEE4368004.1 metallophosphoesterase [Pseudomonas alliivorans]